MKRIAAVALAMALILGLCGCARPNEEEGKWVTFYYCRGDMVSYVPSSVITQELRQISNEEWDLTEIMNLYLQGPRAPELKNVFPPECRIVSLTTEGDESEVCISKEIGQLEGIELTLACACFAKTLMEQNGTRTLRILGEGIQLAGEDFIEIHYADLVLEDHSAVATEPTES